MAKRNIEIQEPEVEVAQLNDLDENEKKPIWYRTGIWCTVTAIAGVAAAALYEIWKSSKESPAPAVDMFKAPTQPFIPHVEEPVTRAIEPEPVVEEPKEEPKKEAPKKAAPATDAKYVGNSDSLVYHTADCRYGKRISEQNKVFLKTKAAATKGGYKPCSYCNP
ncbi:MAG: Ada metal-binding domain-containing protein [Acutalibacteraceae bacterium]|nr:Ada metal-binding domain-containing protein [Acutalibacteraceae bacterium]